MLLTISSHLAARRVILASQSPRRLELLRECGLTFEVIPSTFEENLPKDQFDTPEHYVLENAKQKALEVAKRITSLKLSDDTSTHTNKPLVVIGCDTVVVLNGTILEKPRDEAHAFAMLTSLANAPHHDVYSGVALIVTTPTGEHIPHQFTEKTRVEFGNLEPADIRAYIATGEPMDKAGAYGIQTSARCFVRAIHGCPNNVMGFPVQRFCTELKQLAAAKQL